jgi:hypothetical protein
MTLTAEGCAREIRAELDDWRIELCGEPVDGMWQGMAADALRNVATRLAVQFGKVNPGFDHAGFMRACGFTD